MKPLSRDETLYLLRSPANAESLLQAIANADAGRFVEHELLEFERQADKPYPGWIKTVIWLGLTAFSWGVVLGVIYTAYLWLYL